MEIGFYASDDIEMNINDTSSIKYEFKKRKIAVRRFKRKGKECIKCQNNSQMRIKE